MSVSMDLLLELFPINSALQHPDNELRKVLDRTVGEWLDNFSQPFEQLFLMSATGGWLDAHGRDYGVPRKLDEDDEHYRQRIIYEKLDHLTPSLLSDVYGVKLFTYRGDFNVSDNTLVSDNPHIVQNESFLGTVDEDTIRILDKKFILDNVVTWINSDGEIEYILDTRGKNILPNYSKIYKLTKVIYYFRKNEGIENVKLFLPTATSCSGMFEYCTSLKKVDLKIPQVTNVTGMFSNCTALTEVNIIAGKINDCLSLFSGCSALTEVNLDLPNGASFVNMFRNCSSLTNVKLNLPKLNYYNSMFYNCSNLETINVNIPTDKVSGFKSYVTGLNLQYLTSFIINGEEQL